MVEIKIKEKTRKKARGFVKHLEEEHPEVRGKVKIENTFKKKRKRKPMSFEAQAAAVTHQNIDM